MIWIPRLLLALIVIGIGLWVFGPREPIVTDVSFSEGQLGADLDAYLAEVEAVYDDIVPGTEKSIVWAGEPGQQTPLSLVYLHGFSASSMELDPVHRDVAASLGANLYLARLPGHGRSDDAMGEPLLEHWMHATAEAMAIGRRLGERVIVMGTSTGGTLATIAASEPSLNERLEGLVLVSPNFRPKSRMAGLLSMPFGRQVLPLIFGPTRSWEPANEQQAMFWTHSYPSVATVTLGAAVKAASRIDLNEISTPVLAIFSDDDQVVEPLVTRERLAQWGGPVTIVNPTLGPDDDPGAHVIAGDIRSPGQTPESTRIILDWIEGL